MRLACLLLISLATAQADDWVITNGGLSPDKRLGVAVYPQKPEHIDEADATVLLVDAIKRKIIGPLQEVDSTGGTWGKTTENVQCLWSPDSRLLAVNFRTGRRMYSFQLYRIDGRRAIAVQLPDPRTHPKAKISSLLCCQPQTAQLSERTRVSGARVRLHFQRCLHSQYSRNKVDFDQNANPGAELRLLKDGTIVERRWGFMPKEGRWNEDYSRFGIKNFEAAGDELRFIYRMDKEGKPRIVDVTGAGEGNKPVQ